MSGIAGVYNDGNREALGAMLKKLGHRGPCGKKTFIYKDCALGIAVHPNGSFIKDGNGCVIVDGEIYNLDRKNPRALLSSYCKKGADFLKQLDGEYAIALWHSGHLLLARERLGVKPLYYATRKGTIYFASEIKALQEVSKEIKILPPGYFLSSEYGLRQYWKMGYIKPSISNLKIIMPALRKNLEKAVQKRLEGKSRVGVFLSGGIDSSVIAYLVKKNFKNVVLFSVGTRGSPDLEHASMLAKFLQLPHHIHTYDIAEMKRVLPRVIYHIESFDALLVRSCIPNFLVSRLARQKGIDTVFIGEGGDELFAGYEFLKYLKGKKLHRKTLDLIPALHNTGLQRCDRMPASFGIEAKIPFLDIDFVKYAFRISPGLKSAPGRQEKWILRKSFEDFLPREIAWRKKQKFSQGSGSYKMMERVAEKQISDREFSAERKINDTLTLKNREELLYYRIFRRFFPGKSTLATVGRSTW